MNYISDMVNQHFYRKGKMVLSCSISSRKINVDGKYRVMEGCLTILIMNIKVSTRIE